MDSANELNQVLLKSQDKKHDRVNIAGLIEKTARTIVGSTQIKLSMLLDPNLSDLFIDELLLKRVLQNIIKNSIQATPHNGKIDIAACNIEQGDLINPVLKQHKYIQISIKDNGNGIPEEFINLIMEPYFSTKTKGSGFGLAMTKEIVSSFKGVIEIGSDGGYGTIVVIYLPV